MYYNYHLSEVLNVYINKWVDTLSSKESSFTISEFMQFYWYTNHFQIIQHIMTNNIVTFSIRELDS